MKKVLAILGSPHSNGINAKMLDISIEEAKLNDAEVKTVKLYEKNIGFCKGCLLCQKKGYCVMQDDIQEIAENIKWCDTIILASPVYWGNIPAIVKNMMDRLFGYALKETLFFPKPCFTGKKYILLTSCNTPFIFAKLCGQIGGLVRSVKEFFTYSGIKKRGIVFVSSAHKLKRINIRTESKIRKLVQKCVK